MLAPPKIMTITAMISCEDYMLFHSQRQGQGVRHWYVRCVCFKQTFFPHSTLQHSLPVNLSENRFFVRLLNDYVLVVTRRLWVSLMHHIMEWIECKNQNVNDWGRPSSSTQTTEQPPNPIELICGVSSSVGCILILPNKIMCKSLSIYVTMQLNVGLLCCCALAAYMNVSCNVPCIFV